MGILIYPPAFLLAVFVLVTVHEFGHFLVARASGVRVLRFSIGFGRPLLTWTDRRGTEFVVALIPLGGYVRMLDERDMPGADVAAEPAADSYQRLSPWWRIAIAAGGPGANVLLAALLFALVASLGVGHLAPYTLESAADTPAAESSLPAGVRITEVDGSRVESWLDVALALARRLGDDGTVDLAWQQSEDSAPGLTRIPISNWLADAAEPDFIGELGIRRAPVVVGPVVEDSAAAAAGLRRGDILLRANGTEVDSWSQWVTIVSGAPEQALNLTLLRDGQVLDVRATPGVRTTEAGERLGFIGFGRLIHVISPGPVGAAVHGVEQTWEHSTLVLSHFAKLITGNASPRTVGGPLSIAQFAGDSLRGGLQSFLSLLALLSVSLAVINLLPVPLLDGGHIVFALWEALTGTPASEKVQTIGLQIGLVFVGCLMLLSISNDFLRLL